jgi:transcriptional regulator with PAS, ATPase and Fis domain
VLKKKSESGRECCHAAKLK